MYFFKDIEGNWIIGYTPDNIISKEPSRLLIHTNTNISVVTVGEGTVLIPPMEITDIKKNSAGDFYDTFANFKSAVSDFFDNAPITSEEVDAKIGAEVDILSDMIDTVEGIANAASSGSLGSIKPSDAAPTPARNGNYTFSIGGNKPAWLTAEAGVTTVKAGDGVAVVYTAPSSYTYTHVDVSSDFVTMQKLAELGYMYKGTATSGTVPPVYTSTNRVWYAYNAPISTTSTTLTNFGGLVIPSGKVITRFNLIWNGTAWILEYTDMANTTAVNYRFSKRFSFEPNGYFKFVTINGIDYIKIYKMYYTSSVENKSMASTELSFTVTSKYAFIFYDIVGNYINIAQRNDLTGIRDILSDSSFREDSTVVLCYFNNGKPISKYAEIQSQLSKYEQLKNRFISKVQNYDFYNQINADFVNEITNSNLSESGIALTTTTEQKIKLNKSFFSREFNFTTRMKLLSVGQYSLIEMRLGSSLSAEFKMRYDPQAGILRFYRDGTSVSFKNIATSAVNDIIKFRFIQFYDDFIAVLVNETKGWEECHIYTQPFTYGLGYLPTIGAIPTLALTYTSVLLKEFNVSELRWNRDLSTVIFGASLNNMFSVGDRSKSFQFIAFAGYENRMSTVSYPGANSTTLLTIIDEVIILKPKFVTLMCGTNDVIQSVSVSTFKTNYETMITKLLSYDITPIAFTLPHVNGTAPVAYNTAISDLATKYGLKLVDTVSVLVPATDFVEDGIHLNKNGALKIGNLLKTVVPEILTY